jgi:hypothetical protein
MSRGHGRVERTILWVLGFHDRVDVGLIAWHLNKNYRDKITNAPVSDAMRTSINRAFRNLCRGGAVVEVDRSGSAKMWTLTERHRKEQANERARERRQSRKQQEWEHIFERKETEQKAEDEAQLIKILGLLGSDHDGEALAAARLAEKERRKRGLTWGEIVNLPRRRGRPHP